MSKMRFDDLYTEDDYYESGEWFSGPGDYSPIIEAIGDVILREDEDGYSGDSLVLYGPRPDDGKVGLLEFGWGSCSGCDALQACKSKAEVEALAQEMCDSVDWRSPQEMLAYLRDRDWSLTHWCIARTLAAKFTEGALFYLGALIGGEEKPETA